MFKAVASHVGRWIKIFLIAFLIQTPVLLFFDLLLESFDVNGVPGALALAFTAGLI